MAQVKFYLGEDTLAKWLRISAGFTNNTAAFAAMVENYYWRHQMHEEKDTMTEPTVDLYEDNGGGLHIVCADVRWSGFEFVALADANFAEDAQCILDSETDDWMMDVTKYDGKEPGDLIATYDGEVHVEDSASIGVAGSKYLHLD